MDEVAPKFRGEETKCCFKFQVAEVFGSLAIQGREVGRGEKMLYGFHSNQCENRGH